MKTCTLTSLLVLGGTLAAQTAPPSRTTAVDTAARDIPAALRAASIEPKFDRVLYDDRGADGFWAGGNDWKASFTRDGFTFVPFLGSKAPHNVPFALRIADVRVGDQSLPFDRVTLATRKGDRVTFDRGSIREIYDLALHQLAQSFVIDTELEGDVIVTLQIDSELREDPTRPGLQFTNELGDVGYGAAALVVGAERRALTTQLDGSTLAIRVPASLRGPGPVVIDPIIQTVSAAFG